MPINGGQSEYTFEAREVVNRVKTKDRSGSTMGNLVTGVQWRQQAGDVDGAPGSDPSVDRDRCPVSLKHQPLRKAANGENATLL